MEKNRINFQFARNWKKFLSWYESSTLQAKCAPMWDIQERKIETCFEENAQGIVNWKKLWKEFRAWHKDIHAQKGIVNWISQKNEIETLMLGQLAQLNTEQFILVFLHRGKPEMNGETMTYWEALRVKETLEGDSNGRGGNENVDKITIVNLNSLIR